MAASQTQLIGTGVIWLGASVRFTAPVRIGDRVTTTTEIRSDIRNRASLTALRLGFASLWSRYLARRSYPATTKTLSSLDDHILRDIGLRRGNLDAEKRPFSEDTAGKHEAQSR